MALEERFVIGHILYTYNMFVAQFNDLVDQQERKTVRQGFFDLLQGIYRRQIGIIYRNILYMFVLLDVLFDLAGKINVGAMTGTVSNDMGFDGITYQRQVTNYIQRFMPGRFVGET